MVTAALEKIAAEEQAKAAAYVPISCGGFRHWTPLGLVQREEALVQKEVPLFALPSSVNRYRTVAACSGGRMGACSRANSELRCCGWRHGDAFLSSSPAWNGARGRDARRSPRPRMSHTSERLKPVYSLQHVIG